MIANWPSNQRTGTGVGGSGCEDFTANHERALGRVNAAERCASKPFLNIASIHLHNGGGRGRPPLGPIAARLLPRQRGRERGVGAPAGLRRLPRSNDHLARASAAVCAAGLRPGASRRLLVHGVLLARFGPWRARQGSYLRALQKPTPTPTPTTGGTTPLHAPHNTMQALRPAFTSCATCHWLMFVV